MTDQALKQLQRRRKLLLDKRRKRQFLLLALVLLLGSGAFVFHKEKISAISELYTWVKQNKPGEVFTSSASASPRAFIYDRNFRTLAATYETYAIYARPLEMDDPAAAAELLEKILGLEQNSLLASLKSERGFVWISKGIDQDLANAVKERNIQGIYQVVETKRFYPNHENAAHAVGFVENGQGLDGIEFQYNTLLRGDEINRAEMLALHFEPATEFSRSGTHIVLNIDLMLQAKIERFLEKRIRIAGAASGCVLLMDANTGGVLAMASYPAFNPNHYWEFPSSALNNHVITEPVYPGELALIFQQAAAINLKHERKLLTVDNPANRESLLVLEPDLLKRRILSVAPPVENVDPVYLQRFTHQLGFEQQLLTDLPLKDEIPATPSLVITDPSFHSSALRLLTAFTALMNNGRIVTPHLLHRAYPKESLSPVAPTITALEQNDAFHYATSKDLTDFLAARWLKLGSKGKSSQLPMFFEAHRFAAPQENSLHAVEKKNTIPSIENTGRISQSLLLGAIPGRDPKLTMIAVLSYPKSSDEIYTDALETFGSKFSILSPDQEMVKKMLFVADQTPPVPSPDFWATGETALAANIDSPTPEQKNATDTGDSKKNMPDVTGKSLRAGLQVLQHFNLDVKLVGSGRIVSQHPAAGAELKNGGECILKLQQDI